MHSDAEKSDGKLRSLRFKLVNEEQGIRDSMLRDTERYGRVLGGRDTA